MATIDTIRQYFADILQRSGSEVTSAEINSYVSAVDSGALTLAQVRVALIQSPEGQDVQDVVRLYQTVFGRVPDKKGLNDQVDTLRGPATESDLANSFANSPEFISRFGGNTVNTAFINAVYQQVLGRTPSAGEVDFYLNSGFSAGRIALAFSESPEFQAATSTAVVGFLDAAGQGTAVYTGSLGGTVNVGTTFTLTTGADNSVGTAQNDTFNGVIDTVTATNNTLSVADTINGGAGTDSLNVLVSSATANVAVPVANVSNVENFFVRNLDVDTDGAGVADIAATATFDAGAVVGEKQVWNDRSTGAVSVTNLGTGAVIGVRGDGNTNVGATTFTMATATDAVSIAIDGGVKGGANITRNQTGEAAVTINSTGGANTVGTIDVDTGTAVKSVTINATTALTATLAADYAAASTLTVSGAGKVDLSGAALSANLTTINASASTGGTSVVLGAAAAKFTGGTGADTVGLGGFVVSEAVDGGAGVDTIVMQDGSQLTAATAAKITNFETLRVNDDDDGASDTFDTSLLSGLTSAVIGAQSAGDGVVLDKVSSTVASNITIAGNQAVGPQINVVGASTVGQQDALTLKFDDGAAAKNTLTVANVAAAGVETVNLVTTDNLTLSSATGLTGVTKLMVSGAGDTSITTGALAVNTNTTVDASGLTGTFTFDATAATANGLAITGSTAAVNVITGSAQADAITGGSKADTLSGLAGNDVIVGGDGNDIITGGTGADTLTGGAGNDQFKFAAGDTNATTSLDVITDLNLGTGAAAGVADTLFFANAGATKSVVVLSAAQQASASAAADLSAALGVVATAAGTDGATSQFTFGSDTYIFHNADGNGTYDAGADYVVKVTGVTGTLDVSDIAIA